MYNEEGETTWVRSLDSNGKVREGDNSSCPFLFQGQYYDEEIELAYNRFRYYNPDDGRYISVDPLGLYSGEPNLYAYVDNPNFLVDTLGLYNGEGVRNLDAYNSFHNHQLSPNEYLMTDKEHFSKANESLHNKFQNNPEYAAKMEKKHPGITKHVAPTRRGTHRGTSPKGTTWHHATSSQFRGRNGGIQLVDMADHRKFHKIYHPEDIGGRNQWGGGTSYRK
ncbi:Rhs-family protein [Tenacibaculum finnmarkense genomovar ulcerans]|nr:Rhs-family protein [Tenacibaculum finnmarkense genomovar ulcerans]